MEISPSAPRIALLPAVVRDQIAAGEVVERPASVVKELLENALDAGATQISVDLEEGGARLIRVTDDGGGMGPEDLAMAFTSHATSKLRDPSDLEHIASLGFRGEALASVASVARCQIISRTAESETGHRLSCEGGQQGEVTEAGAPLGTTLEVRDLFYNVPARRRFLKRPSTELGHCLAAVQRAALAHDGVGFVVNSDGRRAYDVEASMDFLARIRRTFGAELIDHLEPVNVNDGDLILSGYLGSPRISRRDTSRQIWMLNGRFLRDRVLSRVLKEAYRGVLEEGRQPVAFLRLAMNPAAVDVNVHPAKSEVRFRDQRRLFGFLVSALKAAVHETDMATPGQSMLAGRARRLLREENPLQGKLADPGAGPRPESVVRERSGRPFVPGDDFINPEHVTQSHPASPASAPLQSSDPDSDPWAPTDNLEGPYLQVGKTFLLRALPDGFEIIDQHALHERLTYELLLQEVRAGKVEVQRLLVPEVVEVSRADRVLLEEHLESLSSLGIELASMGETSMLVSGLPARLRHPDPAGLVGDLIGVIGRTGEPPTASDVLEQVLHSCACRSSIMAGDVLSQEEIQSLLERARAAENDQTCPHARPTRVRFTLSDLERAFHRR
ncbi:MAG: DNA mismatch repair protein MutL [Planctomycetes bacterium]|nr:DNA mismatch repair protein MutL [Planctomycetota bacterium]